jgi:hypothetical protein
MGDQELNVVDLEKRKRRPEERPTRLTKPATEPRGGAVRAFGDNPDRVSITAESLRGIRILTTMQPDVGSQCLEQNQRAGVPRGSVNARGTGRMASHRGTFAPRGTYNL